MSSMKRASWFVAMAFSLSCWMGLLGSLPGDAFAGFVPSRGTGAVASRDDDLRRVQSFLERKLVQGKLRSYGVSHQVAMEKVKEMNDNDLHQLAAMTDRLPAGGEDDTMNALSVVAGLFIIVFVLVVILGLIGIGFLARYLYKKSKSAEGTKSSVPEMEPAAK